MILREIGRYSITSEKVDNITPWWIDIIGLILIVTTVVIALSILIFHNVGSLLFIFLMIGIVVLFVIISDKMFTKSGALIKLLCGNDILDYITFSFSGNSDKDAEKTKLIIEKFEKQMKSLNENDIQKLKEKEESERIALLKKEESCRIFKDVMLRSK
jgi:hypothetical protein